MSHRLRSNLAFCFVDDAPVFLDIAGDRYFTISGSLAAAFSAVARAGSLSQEDLDGLVHAGIFEPASASEAAPGSLSLAPPAIATPSRSVLEEEEAGRSNPARIAEAARRVACARARLALRGFGHCMERLRAQKHARPSRTTIAGEPVDRLAADFNAARRLLPAAPNCLTDSLALSDYLRSRGACADFVIGVRADPHGAHCWLQTDGVLLNEVRDRAASFTPILIL